MRCFRSWMEVPWMASFRSREWMRKKRGISGWIFGRAGKNIDCILCDGWNFWWGDRSEKGALIGAIIVGTGLPQISNEREILMDYYEKEWAKASIMPIVIRVWIRYCRSQDAWSDDRWCGCDRTFGWTFLQSDYRNLFPKEWEKRLVCTVDSVESYLEKFWEEKQ